MAAVQTKLTIKRGKTARTVVAAAGTTISGGEAMELNIDADKITRREAIDMLEELKRWLIEHKWPLAQL